MVQNLISSYFKITATSQYFLIFFFLTVGGYIFNKSKCIYYVTIIILTTLKAITQF